MTLNMRNMRTISILVFSLLCVAVVVRPAATEEPVKLSGRLKVTSDLMAVYPDKNYTEFTGHVEAIYQGRLLRCRRLRAYFSKEARQLDRIEAEENVSLTDKEIEARCGQATYYKDRDVVVLRGDPTLRSGENVFRGQVITVNLTSRRLTIEGAVEADIVPEQAKSK